MRRVRDTAALASALLLLVVACKGQGSHTAADQGMAAQSCPFDSVGTVRAKIVDRRRMDGGGSPRLVVRGVIAPGLSDEELISATQQAACSAYSTAAATGAQVGAIGVFLYREGTDTQGAYSASSGDFSPTGDWADADPTVPLSRWKGHVTVASGYRAQGKPVVPVGGTVRLAQSTGNEVTLWNVWNLSRDENRVGGVPSGTMATVLEHHPYTLPDGQPYTFYKVRASMGGQTLAGWVSEELVEPATAVPR